MRKRKLGARALSRALPLCDEPTSLDVSVLGEALTHFFGEYLEGVMKLELSPLASGKVVISTEGLAYLLRTVAAAADGRMLPTLSLDTEGERLIFRISPYPTDSAELRSAFNRYAHSAGFSVYTEGDAILLRTRILEGSALEIYALGRDEISMSLYRVFFCEF